MSISIKLYQINKKINSTKQPLTTELFKTVSGNFVETSSMYAPTIILSRDEVTSIARFNYCAISWPNDSVSTRYYWVQDKAVLPNGTLSVYCEEDMYATFRENILNSNNYVSRASAKFNTDLVDTQYQIESRYSAGAKTSINSKLWASGDGICVLGIIAQEVTEPSDAGTPTDHSSFVRGSVRYYAMLPADAFNILSSFTRQTGIAADFDASRFVVSCIYIPVERNTFSLSTSNTDINFKLNETANPDDTNHYLAVKNVRLISGVSSVGTLTKTFNPIVFGNHPQVDLYGGMMNFQPYTKLEFVDGLLGSIELDPKMFFTNSASLDIEIDLVTGVAIGVFGPDYVASIQNKIGVDIAINSVSSNSYIGQQAADNSLLASSFSSVVGATGSSADGFLSAATFDKGLAKRFGVKQSMGISTGANIAGAVGGMIVATNNYANNVLANSIPTVGSRGSNGGLVGFKPYENGTYFIQRYAKIITTNINNKRFPRLVCEFYKLSEFTGELVICSNAVLDSSDGTYSNGMTIEEQSTICNQLNTGMYLE